MELGSCVETIEMRTKRRYEKMELGSLRIIYFCLGYNRWAVYRRGEGRRGEERRGETRAKAKQAQ